MSHPVKAFSRTFPCRPEKSRRNSATVLVGMTVAAVLLAGCTMPASKYEVNLNTTTNPEAKKPALSYMVRNTNPDQDETSLRYQEATRFIKTALSAKGMYEAPKPELADVVVELDYGMKGPLPRETEGTAVYHRPVSATTIGTTGIVHPTGSTPVYSVDRPYLYTEIVYEKYINMRARETKSSGEGVPPKSLWSVEVSTTDDSNDLRKYLPIMASVGMDYIGTDSGGQRAVQIDGQDEAVIFVKKGL